jgi:hypothetical protein
MDFPTQTLNAESNRIVTPPLRRVLDLFRQLWCSLRTRRKTSIGRAGKRDQGGVQSIFRRPLPRVFLATGFLAGVASGIAQEKNGSISDAPSATARQPWADWIEREFPFYSAMVYAERAESALLANNRTPRGLVLNLGADLWACFDLDLLRVAAIWEGEEARTYSTAAISYHGAWPSRRERQSRVPLAEKSVWFANGIYPGWQLGTEPVLRDPRRPGVDPMEFGLGPLAEEHGRFRAVRLTRGGTFRVRSQRHLASP